MKRPTIAICSAQVPFRWGGAEALAQSLHAELLRRGLTAELIQLPFKWYPRTQILKSCLAWRLLDLTESDGTEVDLLIATKFPSYVAKHPRKVTWLVHQYRQAYDLFGKRQSGFTNTAEDSAYQQTIATLDTRVLGESKAIYAISRNVARRLAHYNGLAADPLYPPPRLLGRYRNADYGGFVFTVSRLDQSKRIDLMIRAMALVKSGIRLIVAGTGPERDKLLELVDALEIQDRIQFVGYVDDETLIDLYAHCLAVVYVPFDEDYGFVTVEALSSEKPVVTTRDSGGVLEFAVDGVTALIAEPQPESLAERIDELGFHRQRAIDLGRAGRATVRMISWDKVIESLLAH
jgi:glycosyltransferase involved in cell wall biosynthesis